MGSKALVFLGLLVAMVLLLISSEVAAGELAETTDAVDATQEIEATEVRDEKGRGGYGGHRGGHGGGRGGYGGGRGGHDRGGHDGGCRYGCCGRGYSVLCKCCSYAGQPVEPDFVEAETHN
ncbi:glycine-rich protein-like [Primulina huaijiensis]|uniref:glycine-rich protein-like n=1 Tax=Primulina huaijiensis TaxID=1492673 RepID=UPI003CC79A4F